MRVTILSGFLGSGKTTLLRRLLREEKTLRLAVIVNDMSALEVDGDLVRGGHRVSEKNNTLISLYAGSISGSQRQSFADALDAWQARSDIDHIIVETSGSTHPWALIEEIARRPFYKLDTFATLVDAKAFMEDYGSGEGLRERLAFNAQSGRRDTASLLAEQIRHASVIFLTKTDRVPPEKLRLITQCLQWFNPEAQALPVVYGKISTAHVLGTGTFKLEEARRLHAEAAAQASAAEVGDAEGYDISSTVICDVRPFHPQRLWEVFQTRLGQGVHRSKGFIWLASRDALVLLWNQAAGSINLELLAYWKAAIVSDPDGRLLPEEREELRRQLQSADPTFGDRLNELTIIGTARDREQFVRELEGAFCTQDEITHWQRGGVFEDPWPQSLKWLG